MACSGPGAATSDAVSTRQSHNPSVGESKIGVRFLNEGTGGMASPINVLSAPRTAVRTGTSGRHVKERRCAIGPVTSVVWMQIAFAVGLLGVLGAIVLRFRPPTRDDRSTLDVDTGTLSESWLAAQRGSRRDDVSF
jgi:hypothetical protein